MTNYSLFDHLLFFIKVRKKSERRNKVFSALFVGLIMLCFSNVYAQDNININGLVTDGGELGGPLPGVTILVKGTATGTSTDFDGNYALNNVSANATLVFSYVGYQTQEIAVNGQSTINVTLQVDVSQLDEIVIVDYGYGKVKKSDMTGSSASISSAELSTIPISSAAEALTGRLPGVNVTSADGEPGASIRIRVRGGTSLSQSNDPLFVVDGFIVGGIDNIPVNDIASIDVLKDAAATAL